MALIAPLALYVAAVAWLTWPLGAHLGTHLPNTEGACALDTLLLAWVLAWETHALATAPLQLAQANIYHPTPHALFYCETGLGALPFYAPGFLVTGNPGLALNLTLLGGVTLTAWTLHLVVRRWTGSHVGGFLAAWTFLTTRWVLWEWGPVAPNYVVLPYLPLIVLLAAMPAASRWSAIRLVPLLVLQGLTSIYVAPATMIPVALIALGRVVRRATRATGLRLLVTLALAAVILTVGFAGYLVVRLENPHLRDQTVWRGALAPVNVAALPWGPLGRDAATAVPITALCMIGFGAVALACGGPGARSRLGHAWLHSIVWSIAGLVLSSPVVSWRGGRPVILPTAYLKPLYDVLRDPSRLGVAALIGLSLLTGLGWATVTAVLSPAVGARAVRAAVGGCAVLAMTVLMYTEYAGRGAPGTLRAALAVPGTVRRPLPAAYPIAPVPALSAPIVNALARPGGPVLEVPVTLRHTPWPEFQAAAMYHSISHWRPLLNGYSSYWPADFPERMRLAELLPDADAVAALRRKTQLAAILVHLDLLQPADQARWTPFPPPAGLRLIALGGHDLLFAVGDRALP